MGDSLRRVLVDGLLISAVAFSLAKPAAVNAQIFIGPGNRVMQPADSSSPQDADLERNVFLPAERIVLRRLAKARELLKQSRYGEAVRYLGAILDGPEDYFFQPDKLKSPEIHRSLKSEAQRLIGEMPRKGRDLYELQYGTRATRLLAEAVAAGDADRLAEVARRFFHTQSGYEATFLLGLYHLDRAEPLAAALTLQRLLEAGENAEKFEPALSLSLAACWCRAGIPEKAEEVLSAWRRRSPDSTVEVAGRQVSLFDEPSEALSWLVGLIGSQRASAPSQRDRWAMFRGNPARNAATTGSAPLLNLRWRVSAAEDPLVEDQLHLFQEAYQEHGRPAMPGLHPLVVNDTVLMRTCRNLLAVDFVTGRRQWQVPISALTEGVAGNSAASGVLQRSVQLVSSLPLRMWDDATYGTLSSDGYCVFSIEGLMPKADSAAGRNVIIGGQRIDSAYRPYNRLAAHDICTGKLKWHLGGPADQFALPLAETFFLGPPLPLMDRLYVLGEIKGEIRLFALDAASGEVAWSQQVAVAERDILLDPMRRLSGASPSYADGILVCPTSTGAVVALDLATRSLLWGYRYGRRDSLTRYTGVFGIVPGQYSVAGTQQRWADGSLTVADGRVLLTPIESDELHCLNLVDGSLLWKQPRQDDLFVACVHDNKVVLAGDKAVRAVCLDEVDENGRPKPAWEGRTVGLPENALPSGRGFFNGQQYFLPLSTAGVAAIDPAAGQIVQVVKSRNGTVPGNLVCYNGRVISQGINGVELYYQLEAARREAARRLATDPDDPIALALQGEIFLDDGKRSEAIASFRRSYELSDTPRTRILLRDALLDGLRREFASHRHRVAEIETLLDDSKQRATYLRLMATGLQHSGEWASALDYYLRLAGQDEDCPPLEEIDKAWTVRRDRWIQARLASLREEAGDEVASLDAPIEARLKTALAAGSVTALRSFLNYFGNQPAAAEARGELIRRLTDDGKLLEVEMMLWRDYKSSDPATGGAATAELAELLCRAKRFEDAAVCYRRLADEFSEAICRQGKTGKQLIDALGDDHPVRQNLCLLDEDSWPTGKVKDKTSAPTGPRTSSYGRFALSLRGGDDEFFREMPLEYDQNNRRVIGHDPLGRERWQVMLNKSDSRASMPFNRTLTHGRAQGHFLVLATGYKIIALDTLGAPGAAQSEPLWQEDSTNPSLSTLHLARFPIQLANMPWGIQQFHLSQYHSVQNSSGALVNCEYVCFQRRRNLVAVDPISGRELWIRRGVEAGSTLFGDDRFIFALGPQAKEALVFRALDGELLGRRKIIRREQQMTLPDGNKQTVLVPFDQSCLAMIGAQVLLWEQKGAESELKFLNVWQQKDAWPPRTFAAGAKTCLVGQRAIGVLQRDGKFVLLSLADGRELFEAELEPEENLSELFVIPSGDDYLVVTHNPPNDAGPTPRSIQPIATTLFKPISRGRVYMFDDRGRAKWPRPVSIKDQHLLLNQPGGLPLMIFACQVSDPRKTGASRYQVEILCVDKRTGRIAYNGSFSTPTSNLDIVGDPQKKTIQLTMNRHVVTLTLTDEPDTGPTTLEALKKAVRKAVE